MSDWENIMAHIQISSWNHCMNKSKIDLFIFSWLFEENKNSMLIELKKIQANIINKNLQNSSCKKCLKTDKMQVKPQ